MAIVKIHLSLHFRRDRILVVLIHISSGPDVSPIMSCCKTSSEADAGSMIDATQSRGRLVFVGKAYTVILYSSRLNVCVFVAVVVVELHSSRRIQPKNGM